MRSEPPIYDDNEGIGLQEVTIYSTPKDTYYYAFPSRTPGFTGSYPGTPVSGAGGGGGSSGSGSGSGSSSPSEIIDKLTDPCISYILKEATLNDLTGQIKSILNNLGANPNIKLTVTQKDSPTSPKDAEISATFQVIKGITTLNASIELNTSVLANASREYYAAVIIHEAIHAYFRLRSSTQEKITGMDHETMANQYIAPTAEYLSSLYGISIFEASSIAWRGVMGTEAYKNAEVFAIKENGVVTLYSKDEIQQKGIHYLIGLTGKKKCA